MNDPFAELGLDRTASAADVRTARRELAKQHHPDTGGDAARMRAVNEATAAALRIIDEAMSTPSTDEETAETSATETPDATCQGTTIDAPSFVVEALPVETFEALLLATSTIGEVIDDDPPYRLEVLLTSPFSCWCRLELVPDAGASTVSITVAAVDGQPQPSTEQVRDLWIDQLNRLDW